MRALKCNSEDSKRRSGAKLAQIKLVNLSRNITIVKKIKSYKSIFHIGVLKNLITPVRVEAATESSSITYVRSEVSKCEIFNFLFEIIPVPVSHVCPGS